MQLSWSKIEKFPRMCVSTICVPFCCKQLNKSATTLANYQQRKVLWLDTAQREKNLNSQEIWWDKREIRCALNKDRKGKKTRMNSV